MLRPGSASRRNRLKKSGVLSRFGGAQQVGMDDLDRDPLARLEAGHGLHNLCGMNRSHAPRAQLGEDGANRFSYSPTLAQVYRDARVGASAPGA